MKYKSVLLSLYVVFLFGCQQSYVVHISGFSKAADIPDKTCVILSGFNRITPSDLQFQEFKSYVRRALEHQGYQVIDDVQKAKVEILLTYAVIGPILEDYSVNIYPSGPSVMLASTMAHHHPRRTFINR